MLARVLSSVRPYWQKLAGHFSLPARLAAVMGIAGNVMDVRAFAHTLLAGTIFFVCFTGLSLAFLKPAVPPALSGKIMATLSIGTPDEEPIDGGNTSTLDAPPDYSTIEDVVAGLTKESPQGLLPIIREGDKLTPLDAYKTPFVLKEDTKAVIAVTIIDFGLSDTLTDSIINDLPASITLAATPYADSLQFKMSSARKAGKEIWLTVPLQSKDYPEIDTGPLTILSGFNKNQTLTRLYETLGRVTGYAGVAFQTTPVFSTQSLELNALIKDVSQRGLGLTQLDPTDTIINGVVSKIKNVPFKQSDAMTDMRLGNEAVADALYKVVEKAEKDGYATLTLVPSPALMTLLNEWYKTLADKKIQLAPLSYVIYQKNMLETR